MTIELVASGRPCRICARHDAAKSTVHALGSYPPGDLRSYELDPTAIVERELNIRTSDNAPPVKYKDASGAGRVLGNVRDDIVYNVIERFGPEVPSRVWGEFCAKCLRSAAETAGGTDQIGRASCRERG